MGIAYKSWPQVEKTLLRNVARDGIGQATSIRFGINSTRTKNAAEPNSSLSLVLDGHIVASTSVTSPEMLKESMTKFADLLVAHNLADPALLDADSKARFVADRYDDLLTRYYTNVNMPSLTERAMEKHVVDDFGSYPLNGDNAHRHYWKDKKVAVEKTPEGRRYHLAERTASTPPKPQIATWLAGLTGLDWQYDIETDRIYFLGQPNAPQQKALDMLATEANVQLEKPLITSSGEPRYVLQKGYDAKMLKLEARLDVSDERRLFMVKPDVSVTGKKSGGKLVDMKKPLPANTQIR